MVKGISEIVGEALSAGKSRVTIYRALKQLLCAACGETISEGALFTRRSLHGQGLRILNPRVRSARLSTSDAR
jgi:RNase P subunit RPR2